MGESASVRTHVELTELRSTIDRDVDALIERVREDVDPRNLVRRQPLAIAGGLGSAILAAAVGIMTRSREKKQADATAEALIERFGGRIDKLKGNARNTFRKQLQKEMAEVEATGPKEIAWGAIAAALTALATQVAQSFGQKLLGDETRPEGARAADRPARQ